jgi:hypothetical protein
MESLDRYSLESDYHSSGLSTRSTCKENLTRFYFSPLIKIFYLILIILSISTLIYGLIDLARSINSIWLMSVEIFISICVVADVLARVIMQGTASFFMSCTNMFDVVVSVISIAFIVVTSVRFKEVEEIESIAGIAFLVIRNVAQLIRILFFIKTQRKARLNSVKLIDLPTTPNNSSRRVARLDTIEEEKEDSDFEASSPIMRKI